MTWRPAGAFRIGAMRERINVQEATFTVDSAGQSIPTWATVVENEPATFVTSGGTETLRGKQVEAGVNALFIVHYRDTYAPEMRVVYNGTNYGIVYVNQVEGGRRYIELYCKS